MAPPTITTNYRTVDCRWWLSGVLPQRGWMPFYAPHRGRRQRTVPKAYLNILVKYRHRVDIGLQVIASPGTASSSTIPFPGDTAQADGESWQLAIPL